MPFEGVIEFPLIGEKLAGPILLKRELNLTRGIYESVQVARNDSASPETKNKAWNDALEKSATKLQIQTEVKRNLRTVPKTVPLVEISGLIDYKIITRFSPELRSLLDRGEVNPIAVFGIVDYFLRSDHWQLTPEQVVSLAKMFPTKDSSTPFVTYIQEVQESIRGVALPGQTQENSDIIMHDVTDLLTITDAIERRYMSELKGKSIYITDLMRISSNALQIVYKASSRLGALELNGRDVELLSGNETLNVRNTGTELGKRLLLRPDVVVGMVSSKKTRDLAKDAEKLLRFSKSVHIEGLEHIPNTGPAIIAFSHMINWQDKNIAPLWETASLLKAVSQVKNNREIKMLAYLSHYRSVFPTELRKYFPKFFDAIVQRISKTYGIGFIDVAAGGEALFNSINEAREVLKHGGIVLLSPEGVPANEVIPPQRGVGAIARTSHAPTVGVAFREDRLPDGLFQHRVIFTRPQIFSDSEYQGTPKQKDQAFADNIMRAIAQQLPVEQRGVFR